MLQKPNYIILCATPLILILIIRKKYFNNVKFNKNDEWRLKSVKSRIKYCNLEDCLKTLE